MAYNFGDSFDLYGAGGDPLLGYWDSGSAIYLAAGRFAGSQAIWSQSGAQTLTKASGANDPVHHLVVSFMQSATITGSTLVNAITLYDGAAAQCSIVFRSDGAILLTSGAAGSGTVLATFTGAFPAINTWYGFEFEIVVNNTTGSFAVRKNGNVVTDFTATALNTRNGSTNNYANKVTLTVTPLVAYQYFDDFFWQSSASAGTWLGDVRCYTRMPTSPGSSTQFTPVGTRALTIGGAGGDANPANSVRYMPFTLGSAGTISTVAFNSSFGGAPTGSQHINCAIYADNGSGAPGAVLGIAAAPISGVTIPVGVSANSTFTFSPPLTISGAMKIWVAIASDYATGTLFYSSGGTAWSGTTTYASFPVANPTGLVTAGWQPFYTIVTFTPNNAGCVNEAQQDGFATYVYDSNPGDADLYNIVALGVTPTTILGVTSRAFMQKSDSGARTGTVQLKSSATTPSIWDAANKTSGVTLTGSNLIATTSGSNQGVRAVSSQAATSKYYFEIVGTTWVSLNGVIGMGNASAGIGSFSSSGASNGIGFSSGGVLWSNASFWGSMSAAVDGNAIGIAVDFVNNLIWFRVAPSGSWNGNGSAFPNTGVGGISFASLPGGTTLFPIVSAQNSGAVFTANFGGSAFVGAVPSGFTSGWPQITSTTVAAPTLTLSSTAWAWAWRMDTTDPNTSAAWTASAINNAQVGPKVVA